MSKATDEPPDDAPIWRYMDLSKFAALAFSGRLWFAKLQELWANDPWEGFGRARGLRRPSRSGQKSWPAPQGGSVLYAEASGYAAEILRNAHLYVYANSWCLGSETLGMWERYGAGARGVGIESTVGQFKRSLTDKVKPEQYAFGSVHYHPDLRSTVEDFRTGSVPLSGNLTRRVLKIAFKKRLFYKDEEEWRAAIFQEQKRPKDAGLLLPADLQILITSVRVGPRADGPTITAIKEIMKCNGLTMPLKESEILRRPRTRRSR